MILISFLFSCHFADRALDLDVFMTADGEVNVTRDATGSCTHRHRVSWQ